MDVTFRPAGVGDTELIRWALYTAFAWKPERRRYPPETVLELPDAVRYWRDWGRPGDHGVIAECHDQLVGVAFYRLFTEDDHGHGFVDDRTPEICVAVAEAWRGRRVGTRLLAQLAAAARAAGFAQLSLSVDAGNPALRLYERLGYRELSRDAGGVRMLLRL